FAQHTGFFEIRADARARGQDRADDGGGVGLIGNQCAKDCRVLEVGADASCSFYEGGSHRVIYWGYLDERDEYSCQLEVRSDLFAGLTECSRSGGRIEVTEFGSEPKVDGLRVIA